MLNERFSDRRQRLLRLKVMREGGRLPSSSRLTRRPFSSSAPPAAKP